MKGCINSANCMEIACDKCCVFYVQTNYLLQRNNIQMNNRIFQSTAEVRDKGRELFDNCWKKTCTLICNDTTFWSDMMTLYGILRLWEGSAIECVVYHLNYSQYADDKYSYLKVNPKPEEFQLTQLWMKDCDVLVISNLDYVFFNNYCCRTLLDLLQTRSADPDKTTIVVSPKLDMLVSDNNPFFQMLINILNKEVIKW